MTSHWQHVVRKSLVAQVAASAGRVAITGGQGVGKSVLIQQIERHTKNCKLMEIENGLEAILMREKFPDTQFVHVDELPEGAVRALMKEAVSSVIQMQCILAAVGGHPGNLQRIHQALMDVVPKYLADQAQIEFEIRTGKRTAPSPEMKMLEIDSLSIERDRIISDLGGSDSALGAESESFLAQMVKIEKETSETSWPHDRILGQLFLIESIRHINSQMRSPGFLSVNQHGNMRHPVILSFLRHGILWPVFSPLPRLVVASTLTRKYLHAWVRAKEEEMSLPDRAKYNLLLLKNRGDVLNKLSNL